MAWTTADELKYIRGIGKDSEDFKRLRADYDADQVWRGAEILKRKVVLLENYLRSVCDRFFDAGINKAKIIAFAQDELERVRGELAEVQA